jgi:hypothetical protein
LPEKAFAVAAGWDQARLAARGSDGRGGPASAAAGLPAFKRLRQVARQPGDEMKAWRSAFRPYVSNAADPVYRSSGTTAAIGQKPPLADDCSAETPA